MKNENKFKYLRDESLTPKNRANRFIQQLGYLPKVKDCEKEMDKLYKKFPELFENFMSLSETRSGKEFKDGTIYDIKNENLIFSRTISSLFQAPVWAAWMIWILDNLEIFDALDLEAILDCGCDTGVSTFFLAALYPEAMVEGVDSCAKGIEIAQKTKERHGFLNTKFTKLDLVKHLKSNQCRYDFINSTTCLREIFQNKIEENDQWSLDTHNYLNIPYSVNPLNTEISQALRGSLKDSKCMALLFERIGSPEICFEFFNHLGLAGANIVNYSGIKFTTFDDHNFTLIALLRFNSEIKKFSMLEALAYLAKTDELMLENNHKQRDLYECLIFEAIANKHLQRGCFYEYENYSGIAYAEIWITEYLFIGHFRNVHGMAETKYWPKSYSLGPENFMESKDLELMQFCKCIEYHSETKKQEILTELKKAYSSHFMDVK